TMELLRHAANVAAPDAANDLIALSQQRFADNPDVQVGLLDATARGFQQRGVPHSPQLREWALTLARTLLAASGNDTSGWLSRRLSNTAQSDNPWGLQSRPSADGQAAA